MVVWSLFAVCLADGGGAEPERRELNVLFIGNSFTARHQLSTAIQTMAEAGNPGLTLHRTEVIYGGRTLQDHWRLGTPLIVKQATVTAAEKDELMASLAAAMAADPKDKYAPMALNRHRELTPGENPKRWDLVVLQSYRDDVEGDPTLYAEYATKFAELIQAQGGRVILYETTPLTQHEVALAQAPDFAPILAKERAMAKLANQIDAAVAPMALVAHKCQTQRPDLTLRFVNDAHLNQTMAYLTACTLYAAIFDKSPVGLELNAITDIRHLEDGSKDKTKDRDGGPITRVFSDQDRSDLQRLAWEGYSEFLNLRREVKTGQ